ncbi:hypothetical protein ACA910_004674 [Epithemia clementina (nom. ined.)]
MDATTVTVTVGEDRPKRPLSAYNIFFRDARQNLLANRPVRPEGIPRRSHGRMGFAEMAQTISRQWNTLHPTLKEHYEQMGCQERALYKRKLTAWKYVTGQTTRKLHKKKPKMSKKTSVVQKGYNSNSNHNNVQQRILPAPAASTTTTEHPPAMMNRSTCNYRTAGEVGVVSAAAVGPTAMATTLDQNDPLLIYEEAQHKQLLSSIMGVHNSATTSISINQTMERPQPQFPDYVSGMGADAANNNNNTLNHCTMKMLMEQANLIQEINILLSDIGPAGLQQAAMPQTALPVATPAAAAATPMDPMTALEVPEQAPQMLPQQEMAPLIQDPQSQQQPLVATMDDCDLEPYECGAVPQQDEPMELIIMAQQLLPLLNNEYNYQDENNNNNNLDMDEFGLISSDLLDHIFEDDES